jgi:hypothetical protein
MQNEFVTPGNLTCIRMSRPYKNYSILIAILLLLAQTQTLWAVTSQVLSSGQTRPEHNMSMKMTSAEMADMLMTLECENLCDRSTQNPSSMPFVETAQPELDRLDLSFAYPITLRTRINNQVEKLELPLPGFNPRRFEFRTGFTL